MIYAALALSCCLRVKNGVPVLAAHWRTAFMKGIAGMLVLFIYGAIFYAVILYGIPSPLSALLV